MRPQPVYITTRFERFFWRPILLSVGLAVVVIVVAAAALYVLSFPPFRWLI